MKILAFTLFLFSIFTSAFAMELTTSVSSGNLSFDKTASSPVSTFPGTKFPWGISVYGEKYVTDNTSIKAGVFYDPVLRYTINTLFQYQYNFFKLGVGPFFGIFNTPQTIMKSGITTTVKIELPGVIFASLEADSSIGARFVKVGDYIQEKNLITIGYYIPNAICSLNLVTKSFVMKQGDALEVDDSFTEYSFKVDIFQKNVAFRTVLSFAYQTLSRSYFNTSTGITSTNILNSLVFGTHFKFNFSDNLSLFTTLESNVYSFGYLDASPITLPQTGIGLYLFRATTGITVKL